ncbi:MAG: hypothetical protein WCQ96_03125 [Patescibacteria group bacterium]
MKKILLVLAILFAFPVSASTIPEGAIVKTAGNPDVYIVKYNAGKQYKRLVLNPLVFKSYGHLKWENLLTISDSEMSLYTTSSLVKVDGSAEVYELTPTGDNGTKQRLTSTWGRDVDSVYIINSVDFGNYEDRGDKYVMSREEVVALDQKEAEAEAKAEAEAARIAAEKQEAADQALYEQRRIDSILNNINFIVSAGNAEILSIDKDMAENRETYKNVLLLTEKDRLDKEYRAMLSRKNFLIDQNNKLNTIIYEINDYRKYGTIVPAIDRAYLLLLGIDFQC